MAEIKSRENFIEQFNAMNEQLGTEWDFTALVEPMTKLQMLCAELCKRDPEVDYLNVSMQNIHGMKLLFQNLINVKSDPEQSAVMIEMFREYVHKRIAMILDKINKIDVPEEEIELPDINIQVVNAGEDGDMDALIADVPRHHPLVAVFAKAIEQVTHGKGQRHGGEETPFEMQRWHRISDAPGGIGGLVFQAVKKFEESQEKENFEDLEREILGAIVYMGMTYLKCKEGFDE